VPSYDSDHDITLTGQIVLLRSNALTDAHQITTVVIALHRPWTAIHQTSGGLAVSAALEQLDFEEELFQLILFPQHKLYRNTFYTNGPLVFLVGIVSRLPAH